jgi:hypothetical protein
VAMAAQKTAEPFDVLQEERYDEDAEKRRIENRRHDVQRLDQVFREAHEEREADREEAPECGEPFGDADVARLVVRGQRAEVAPEVDRGGGAEGVEFAGLRRQRRGKHHGEQAGR